MTATPESLQKFVQFCQTLKGDEKGESQIFLDRWFRAFGYEGAIEAGATYEARVKQVGKQGKTGFADLVWKPRLLIEMKKRGTDLRKHYPQAFDYWIRLVPERPRYVILCNFDEFWIFDFDLQLDTPVDIVLLTQLPNRISAFRFMERANRTPVFRNNQVQVTERAARRMGELLVELTNRGVDSLVAQRFVLQSVLAMFAEDRGLLPNNLFIACVQDCLKGQNSYDLLGGLFREMNSPGITPAGRYQGVDYFNGGLFSTVQPLELSREELKFLEACALEDWSKVRPAIFGNLFESVIDQNQRHAHGVHFTSESDIMKIVRPTISRYWEERINAANTITDLVTLHVELQGYKVLDPACGSGNFLYIAYQELKRIEQLLLGKISEQTQSSNNQVQMSFVTPQQFYGMDINPFAVELARVTMTIARKIAIDNFNLIEPALPLDSLDHNIECKNALFEPWVAANAIIGNPPFLGGKQIRKILGDFYISQLAQKFPDVKDSVDFCTYWFRLAHDVICETRGRAGLVGTNSISQGKSRVASLDYIAQNGGYVHEAVSSQVWPGAANVHVSIANWSLEKPVISFLDNRSVEHINSALKDDVDLTPAIRLTANLNWCFTGVTPVGKGFIVSQEQVSRWNQINPKNTAVVHPFLEGNELATGSGEQPSRWIIDFEDLALEAAREYEQPFQWVQKNVKLERDKNRRPVYQKYWWRLGERRPAMRAALKSITQYFAVTQTSKWAIFVPCPSAWLPNARTRVVASDDFYILGILTSEIHRLWMKAQMSTLKADISYTHNTCFETFPFPQIANEKLVAEIRTTALELHDYRSLQMKKKNWGITDLYNEYFHEPTSHLARLHARLDRLTMQLYGFELDDNILEGLLALNLELAAKEQQGNPVIGPWDPTQSKAPLRENSVN
jgi:SAM-dependent methyltransferase